MKKNLIKFLAIMLVCALACGIFPQTGVFAADVKLSEKKKTITVGESFTLTLKNATGKITWKSSDKKVATVKKGVVTGVSEGKAKIVAKNDGKKYTCKVTVKQAVASDRIEVIKTGIKAANVALCGENATVRINPDNWEECEISLVNAEGKILMHEVYSEDIDGLTTELSDPKKSGYIAMDNGLILSYLRGYYKSNGKKAFNMDWQENARYILQTSEFSDGIALVMLGETFDSDVYDYLINKKGKVLAKVCEIVDFKNNINEWLRIPSEGMSAYIRCVGEDDYELLGYYNNKGKLIEVKDKDGNNYEYGWDFSEGLAAVSDKETMLYGFINKKGKLVIPCEYVGIWGGFYQGYLLCSKIVNGEEKTGVIDKKGNIVIPFEYDEAGYRAVYKDGLFRLDKNGKSGVVNIKNEVVIPFEYDGIVILNENLILAIDSDSKFGVIDNKNNVVIPFEYSSENFWLYSDKYNMITLEKDGKYGYLSFTGEVVVPFEYDDISNITENGIIYAIKDGELYIIKLK